MSHFLRLTSWAASATMNLVSGSLIPEIVYKRTGKRLANLVRKLNSHGVLATSIVRYITVDVLASFLSTVKSQSHLGNSTGHTPVGYCLD